MVDLSRRKTILGMGLLAGGSGAAFSSAAFQDSVSPDADMRVIVEERLNVRAGENFPDSTGETTADEIAYITTSDSTTPTEALFDGTDPEDGVSRPAVAANQKEDGSFAFAVSVDLDETLDINSLIEVENQNVDETGVGIKFLDSGADADSSPDENQVEESTVANGIFTFQHNSSTVSGNDFDAPPEAFFNVDTGETEQIDLAVDTDSSPQRGEIVSAAAGADDDIFAGRFDAVDLVNTIEIGTEDPEE